MKALLRVELDVQSVVPEAVASTDDGKHLTVNYNALVSLLAEDIKELEVECVKKWALLKEIRKRLESLGGKVSGKEARSRIHTMGERIAVRLEERLALFVKLQSLGVE